MPFEDNSFDYVMSFQCVEHLPNPLKALSEMSRVARKKVFVSIPNPSGTQVYSKDYWQSLEKRDGAEREKITMHIL